MNSATASPRPRASWLGLGVLVALSAGCMATSMTARYARVPVLVGPVPCIGCQAASSPDVAATAPITDSAVRSSGFVVLPKMGEVDFFSDEPPLIDFKAETAIPDVCKGEIRVSNLKAESLGVFAFVYAHSQERVDISGSTFFVPHGSCGPRLWPYSGPQGIVVFQPTGSFGGGSP